jgi:hypothetical protein
VITTHEDDIDVSDLSLGYYYIVPIDTL